MTRILETMLTRIEGLQTSGTIVIGCTNFPQNVETALLERLRNSIFFPLPNFQERKLYLKSVMQGIHKMEDNEFTYIGSKTEGYSYRHLKKLVDESKDISVQMTKEATHFIEKHVGNKVKYQPCFCIDLNCGGIKMNYKDKMSFLIQLPLISLKIITTVLNTFGIPDNKMMLQNIEDFRQKNGEGFVSVNTFQNIEEDQIRSTKKCNCKCKKIIVSFAFCVIIACVLGYFIYIITNRVSSELYDIETN